MDRRFDREHYDAELAVEEFADRLRDEVNPDQVVADLLATAQPAFQPSSVAIWIRADELATTPGAPS